MNIAYRFDSQKKKAAKLAAFFYESSDCLGLNLLERSGLCQFEVRNVVRPIEGDTGLSVIESRSDTSLLQMRDRDALLNIILGGEASCRCEFGHEIGHDLFAEPVDAMLAVPTSDDDGIEPRPAPTFRQSPPGSLRDLQAPESRRSRHSDQDSA